MHHDERLHLFDEIFASVYLSVITSLWRLELHLCHLQPPRASRVSSARQSLPLQAAVACDSYTDTSSFLFFFRLAPCHFVFASRSLICVSQFTFIKRNRLILFLSELFWFCDYFVIIQQYFTYS